MAEHEMNTRGQIDGQILETSKLVSGSQAGRGR